MRAFQPFSNRIKDFRIRTKLFLSNMILILFISTTVGGVAIYASTKFIEANTKDLSMQVIHQVSDNIENKAKEAFTSSVYLLSDTNIRQIVAEQGEVVTSESYPAFRSRMEFLLAQYGNGNPFLNAIMIQTSTGQLYWWENKKGLDHTLNHNAVSTMTMSAETYLQSHQLSMSWTPSLRERNEVFLIRDFVDVNQIDRSLGTIIYSLDANFFLSLGSGSSIIKQSNVAILNPFNELLVGGGSPETDKLIRNSISNVLSEGDAAMATVEYAGADSHLFVQERTPTLGWRVLCFIPMSVLLSGTQIIVFVIVLVSLLAVLISTGIAAILSNSSTRNIKILEQTMRRVEDGNFDVRIVPLGKDEIGSLSLRFNFMLARINELINIVYKEQIAKQQAEFTVLRSQINPHFLYNTLGTVKWYARMNEQPEIERMISSVIDLLKSSVRRVGEFHSLEQEITQLKNYVFIQKIGYGDAFQMEYEVNESLLACEVPYFILQPLVENAILHGIEMSKGIGKIQLSAKVVNRDLILTVEDNGKGMDTVQVANILHVGAQKESVPGVTGIGIPNVHERIQLYYGPQYGLSYESELGLGTKANVRIPYKIKVKEGLSMLNAMIVEDNAIYRYAIKSIIRWEDYGFHIVNEALNGVHALDILQHQHVDLILTDISMPEMNGIDLIQKVKQQDDSIKIVALSSFDDFRYVKEALKLGAEDYLLKHDLEPESLQQLLAQMKTKIEDELHLKRQAAIRNENLQEMWYLLGRKLIFGELKTVDEMEDQARAIRFPIPTGPIAIMLFEGECNANSTRALLSELGEVPIHIPISDHRSVIMRHFPNETSELTCRDELLRHAAVLMENTGEASTLTIGISSIGYELPDWRMLYRQAEKALEQSIYDGVGQVYSYWAKPSEIQGVEVSMKAYASAIQSGQFEAVDKQTELFFDLLLTRRLSLEELKVVIHEATILTKAAAIGRGKFSASAESTYRQINRAIEAFPTIQQLKQLFQTWQKELSYEAMGNTPFRKEIQAAITYIEEHYAEDITVSKLSESLHLSSNYVSNLFKSETGLRFVEYLNRYRIRRAKLLLQDPSWKVYEVAEKTGFQEASYFCKVFKELEGKTVKEFRCES